MRPTEHLLTEVVRLFRSFINSFWLNLITAVVICGAFVYHKKKTLHTSLLMATHVACVPGAPCVSVCVSVCLSVCVSECTDAILLSSSVSRDISTEDRTPSSSCAKRWLAGNWPWLSKNWREEALSTASPSNSSFDSAG